MKGGLNVQVHWHAHLGKKGAKSPSKFVEVVVDICGARAAWQKPKLLHMRLPCIHASMFESCPL